MQLCLVGSIVLYTLREVVAVLVLTVDSTTEVVTAIDNILNKWETVLIVAATVGLATDIHF